MGSLVYTLGYTGRTPAEIAQILDDLGAVLLDIRYSPRSRVPHWNQAYLAGLFGARYVHVRALGNVNYKLISPIQIADYEAGKANILARLSPVVLMCACKDYDACHRKVVADMLRRDGFQVAEVGQQPAAIQPVLFDF